MPLTLADLDFLTSDKGSQLLQRLAHEDLSEGNLLPLLTQLRRDFTAEQASAALTLAQLRLRAVDKFGDDAQHLFFTDDALQQASHPLVRHYRAQEIGPMRVVDAGCGIGADSMALVRAGAAVTGLDIDPVRVAMARLNAQALGLDARFEVADVRDGLPDCDFAFFDPARRDQQGKRLYDVEQYQPPLSTIRRWDAPKIAVKLSPGVQHQQLEAYAGSVEFISVNGDLKEAVLWLGTDRPLMVATLLAEHGRWHWPLPDTVPAAPLAEPRGWLVEPDPALLRAGLVQAVAVEFGGALLDETIAYFTTDAEPQSPWLRSWRVLDWMPFNLKRLRAYLRERSVGEVTVKKRGSALSPEELIAKLKLKGDQSRVLALTRCRGQQIVIVCEDYAAAQQPGQPP